jgi:hypothetical protein
MRTRERKRWRIETVVASAASIAADSGLSAIGHILFIGT